VASIARARAARALGAALAALAVAAAAGAAAAGAPSAQLAAAAADRARFIDAEPRGPSVEERLEEIRRRIQAALYYPPIARRQGLEGVAWVQFEIDRGGTPHDVALARSSGHPVLDRAARRTVDRAGRLPWVYGRIEVPIRFSLGDPT
jgi:protein TonB